MTGCENKALNAITNLNDHSGSCHPERSEGSDAPCTEILRCAQDDKTGGGWDNSLSRPYSYK
jgi:hypothetical protein